MSEGVAEPVTRTMAVRLKVWRYDSATGERALEEYEIEAPEEATLLDCLDLVKDRVDGTLAYRKSCRMMICGSCGMRMDGAAVLACKTRMQPIVESGHVPVISAMGNLPIVRDLVVDMEPFWSKFRAVGPWLQPGYDRPEDGKEYVIPQERMNVIHKEALCINCGCCVSECNAMESDPDFLGPQALAKGMRFVGDPRDGASVERLERYNGENGIWECTRCFYCNERCPKGVDPRDAIAKLGAESIRHGIDRDVGAKHAKWFTHSSYTTGWLRETELVPKSLGILGAIKELSFARQLIMHNKAGIAFPPHVAERVKEARALRDLVRERGRPGALGIVQGERALARLAHGAHEDEDLEQIYERPNAAPRPYLPEEKGEAPAGANEGMGSRTQADVTPGAKPTSKPEGGA
jgi:succinate dehydrogenase iron-sulfur subunit